ncbi:MAG: MBL fold metallo-hydrolase [Ignavibacteriae bacterium]|nr:MBL fold metallo-hydrolase [Ignavibacteriota bacterium]
MSSQQEALSARCPRVTVLGSSSAGNGTLVRSGATSILIDCGFPPEYINGQMADVGLKLSDLTAVFITHTHGDHVNQMFVRRALELRIPIFCPTDIELHLQTQYTWMARASHRGVLRPIMNDCTEVGNCLVRTFPVPHDSAGGCFGYSIFSESPLGMKKVTVATDIAFATESIIDAVAESDIVVIESNHDLEMLENSGRPVWLKKRIRERGHLSNDESADIVLRAIDRSSHVPQTIALAHVSQQCNTNAFAVQSMRESLRKLDCERVTVAETFPFTRSAVFSISAGQKHETGVSCYSDLSAELQFRKTVALKQQTSLTHKSTRLVYDS